jgi:hypothetical protein
MIEAKVNFLSNNAFVELSQSPLEVQEQLQSVGVLTNPNLIMLDNARMLKIELYADDTTGENILKLINNKKDTLGVVNRLCNHIRCMDYRDDMMFSENLENGKYSSLNEALKSAEKMREQRRIKNKKKEQCR